MVRSKFASLALAIGLVAATSSVSFAVTGSSGDAAAASRPRPAAAAWHHRWHRPYGRRHFGRYSSHSYTAFSRRLNGTPCGIDCRRSRGE